MCEGDQDDHPYQEWTPYREDNLHHGGRLRENDEGRGRPQQHPQQVPEARGTGHDPVVGEGTGGQAYEGALWGSPELAILSVQKADGKSCNTFNTR